MTDGTNIAGDPEWFLTGIDTSGAMLTFAHTSRAALSSAPFLDERFTGGASETRQLPISDAGIEAAAPAFVFHTAFCCSTLLATVLDQPGKALSLKEPGALMALANIRRMMAGTEADQRRFDILAAKTIALLARRFDTNEKILIKPTNAANNLLEPAIQGGSRVLLLYSDLRAFLVSVIKKGEDCRRFVRHLFNIFRLDRPDIEAWPERQKMLMTDLQIAVLVWNIQIDLFENVVRLTEAGQVRTLKVDDFLGDPSTALGAVQAFFELGYSPDEIEGIAGGPSFRRHSKMPGQDYDTAMREAEKKKIEDTYANEINSALEWAAKLRGGPVPSRLERSVVTENQPC